MATRKLQAYEVDLDPIGIGWFGKIYKAHNSHMETVVIKELNNIEMGKTEAEIMKSYGSHKFLPEFYEYFLLDDACYIVMEYCPGEKLGEGDVGMPNKRRPLKEAHLITLNVLRGLKHLHANQCLHNDIEPKNILVNNNPNELKIIDFGLSVKTAPDSDLHRKDLYQTALLCIYMITGIVSDSPVVDLLNMQIVSDDLQAALYQAIHPDEKLRYASAQEFIDRLESIKSLT